MISTDKVSSSATGGHEADRSGDRSPVKLPTEEATFVLPFCPLASAKMANNSTTEAFLNGLYENDTLADAFVDTHLFPYQSFVFGPSLILANAVFLGLFFISATVGRSVKIVIQSLIFNDIVLSLCVFIYGIYALKEKTENISCVGFLIVPIATVFSSHMTATLLAFFNHCAILWPAWFNKLASTRTTATYISCIWLVSWACAFGLVGWTSSPAPCNVYEWFTRAKALISAAIQQLCVCLVLLFNVKVMFALRQLKNNPVSASNTISENIELAASPPLHTGEPREDRGLHGGMSGELPKHFAQCDMKQHATPSSMHRWKNDPRRKMTSSELTSRAGTSQSISRCAASGTMSARDKKFRRTPVTLSMPTIIFLFLMAAMPDREASYWPRFRAVHTNVLMVKYLSTPILLAWRLVAWDDVKNRLASFKTKGNFF